jgi:hypothetical protein
MPDTQLLNRIRSEFLEMRGLHLTLAQVQRLCGIERTQCQQILALLVASRFLCVNPNGIYARLFDGAEQVSLRPAKAKLKRTPGSSRAS